MTPRGRRFAIRAIVYGTLLGVPAGYAFWPRGRDFRDGRHDRGENGMWLTHAWMGDDTWFAETGKTDVDRERFRGPAGFAGLAALIERHRIRDLFPHLCPAQPDATVMPVDDEQVERLLDALPGRRVLPWVGGIFDVNVYPGETRWRTRFVRSAVELLTRHPRLGGLHLNVEPLPSGNPGYLDLLGELRAAMPASSLLSVAAYPPPTMLHPFEDVHWDEAYYRRVAAAAGQVVPMMYDTAIRFRMMYRDLMAAWVREVLAWSEGTPTLLGLPAYDDAGSGYHDPSVENLEEALWGIHDGLAAIEPIPDAYRGIALYSDWEMTDPEWETLRTRFLAG